MTTKQKPIFKLGLFEEFHSSSSMAECSVVHAYNKQRCYALPPRIYIYYLAYKNTEVEASSCVNVHALYIYIYIQL